MAGHPNIAEPQQALPAQPRRSNLACHVRPIHPCNTAPSEPCLPHLAVTTVTNLSKPRQALFLAHPVCQAEPCWIGAWTCSPNRACQTGTCRTLQSRPCRAPSYLPCHTTPHLDFPNPAMPAGPDRTRTSPTLPQHSLSERIRPCLPYRNPPQITQPDKDAARRTRSHQTCHATPGHAEPRRASPCPALRNVKHPKTAVTSRAVLADADSKPRDVEQVRQLLRADRPLVEPDRQRR